MASSYILKSGNNKRRWPKALLIAGVVALALIICSVLVIRRTYEQNLRPLSSSQQTQDVTIPLGASVKEIAQILDEAQLIREAWAFEWYVRNNDAREALQAGTYPLRPNQSVQEIVAILTNGKVSTDLVTILPGQRLDEIKATLINYGFSEKDVETALDPAQYADHPALVDKPASASLEGYIFPESFQKTATTNPSQIIRQALDEMQEVLTPDVRAGIVRRGLTVHQGIILASIIDQESGSEEDKPIISQVFQKRINIGMQLGSDVTAIYGAILDEVSLPDDPARAAAISVSHDSPYNTRIHGGLPPGPIGNVSKSALQAVGNPAATDYLFFVAGDPDEHGNPGKTYFARTVEEHEANVAEHCKILC
jgi:UPF0755 protein